MRVPLLMFAVSSIKRIFFLFPSGDAKVMGLCDSEAHGFVSRLPREANEFEFASETLRVAVFGLIDGERATAKFHFGLGMRRATSTTSLFIFRFGTPADRQESPFSSIFVV